MVNYDVADWWYCLNPREANMVRYCQPFFVIMGSFIERTVWDAFAIASGIADNNKLLSNWLTTYQMYYGVIIDPDGDELEVVYFAPYYWLQVSAFFASGAADDIMPCYLRAFE